MACANPATPEIMIDSPPPAPAKHRRRDKGLLLIATYKLLQALLFAGIGVGVLRLLHKDVDDVLAQVAAALRFNPESRFVNFLLDKASLINDPLLKRIGAVAFGYAGISMVEGIGLSLEKVWAEYLTLAITASFLPWELFEVLSKLTPIRLGLLAANAVIFLYLLKLVTERGKVARETRTETAD